MKKIISLLLTIIMLLFVVGCNNQEAPKESETEKETTKETEKEIVLKETESTGYPYENLIGGYEDWPYNQFEHFLRTNTDIVRAKYVKTVKKSLQLFARF